MPCFDNEYHHDSDITGTEIFDGNHLEICSPLCSDHDCHTHITLTLVKQTTSQPKYLKAQTTVLKDNIATPYFVIWQPPKIS